MLRFGYISEVDADTGRARVSFSEDEVVSPWLAMVATRTKGQQNSTTFEIEEHVACMLTKGGRSGVILGAIYDNDNSPSSDAGAGVLVVNFPNGNSVKYTESTNKLEITATGGVEVSGDLSVTGKITATQNIESASDVKAGLTSLNTHVHLVPGVTTGPGSATSNPPTV